jgi:hypothetical protein
VSPPNDTAADLDAMIWYFAHPLPADRRDAFCQEAQDALTRLRVPGPGVVHRTLARLLRDYFVPPLDDAHKSIGPNHHRPSKLVNGAPLA